MGYCFGVDIGGTTIKMGFFSHKDGLLKKWEIPTRKGKDPTPVLEDIKISTESCLREYGVEKEDILGIGMAAPGPVTADGVLHGTVNIGWGDVALGEEASKIIGISPVLTGNDARVAALGEYTFGAGAGRKSILMLTLGTGVGGGLIQDGHIFVGDSGAAGEIGHMVIRPSETESCSCGRKGCLEQYASATGMVRMAKKALETSTTPSLLREESITAKTLWEAAQKGDTLALEVTHEVSRLLAICIANACYIADPEMVVIGGGVSAAGEFLLNMVREKYMSEVFPHCRDKVFALAKLRNDAGIYGAAALVFGKK